MNNHGVRKRTFYFRLYADTDTVIAVSRPGVADKTITSGTVKSVPYMVRRKTQLRTCVTRNVTVSTIVSIPGHCNENKKTESVRL